MTSRIYVGVTAVLLTRLSRSHRSNAVRAVTPEQRRTATKDRFRSFDKEERTVNYRAIIGTYTDGESEGLYSCEVGINEAIEIQRTGVIPLQENPAFLAQHPRDPYLYAVHEVAAGGVTSLQIHANRKIQKLNRQPSGAGGPCHCSVHPSGEFLFVAHYTGAAVSVLPIKENGHLKAPSDVVFHKGTGPLPDRQSQPHPHSVNPGPNGRFLYVPDLGADKVVTYEFNRVTGTLDQVAKVRSKEGAGPRHLDFHPTESILYLGNELNSTVSVYERDDRTGELTELDTHATLPSDFARANQVSEICVHPSGNWVYVANRGHNSIAVFEICDDGNTKLLETIATGGEWPRHFALTPNGQALFAQNRKSDSITAFHIHETMGSLIGPKTSYSIPNPAYLLFLN